jgi:hypothetical protein
LKVGIRCRKSSCCQGCRRSCRKRRKRSESFVDRCWSWLGLRPDDRVLELLGVGSAIKESRRRALKQQKLLLIGDGSLFGKFRTVSVTLLKKKCYLTECDRLDLPFQLLVLRGFRV